MEWNDKIYSKEINKFDCGDVFAWLMDVFPWLIVSVVDFFFKEEHAFFYCVLLFLGGWLLLLTTYSTGKADTGTSFAENARTESVGCCQIPAGA